MEEVEVEKPYSETNFNFFYLHCFYLLPINCGLVLANVNTMNGKTGGDINTKYRVTYKMRPAEIINDSCSHHQKGKQDKEEFCRC